MTAFAIILVLVSAGMHVGWNLICKSKRPSAAFFLVATTASVVAFAPVTIYLAPMWISIPLGAFLGILIFKERGGEAEIRGNRIALRWAGNSGVVLDSYT